MIRILLLLIGYACGLLQNGYYYGKTQGIDIRTKGSGNAGATNSLRVMGFKAGFIVFLGDFFKCFLPCLIVRLIFAKSAPELVSLYMMYTGVGVILGHNYPFYLHFRGGKGIASSVGLFGAFSVPVTLCLCGLFLIIVYFTEYVSLGSLVLTAIGCISLILMAVFHQLGFAAAGPLAEFIILTLIVGVLAFWRHRSNINRLLHGTENHTRLFKKKG